MDERNSTKDILLAVILVISTLVMVVRLWQDWIVALATGIMMFTSNSVGENQAKTETMKRVYSEWIPEEKP